MKPPVRFCCSRSASRWRAQLRVRSTAPNMIVVVERRPARCAVSCTSSHWAVFTLSGQRTRADLVVEDLRGRAGKRGEARVAQAREVVVERAPRASPRPARPRAPRTRGRGGPGQLLHRAADLQVVSPVNAGWMPPWRQTSTAPRSQASWHRRTISSTGTTYGGPAQVLGQLALGERAEAAAEVADVRVVDVARDDVADRVAVRPRGAARRRRRAPPSSSRPRASKSAVTSSSSSSIPRPLREDLSAAAPAGTVNDWPEVASSVAYTYGLPRYRLQ